ncbi:acetyltransferase [Bacillaceae bacterium JMAK1]|nr:acetyltransferase [Bacillaceae bacterium JMAK1]
MQIIQLTERDDQFDEAVELYWKTWGEEGGKVFYEDAMIHSLQDPSGIPSFYIAIDERQAIIGTYALLRNDLNSRQDLRPWLACLYVRVENRGQQLGAKFLEHGLKEAAKRGYHSLYLTSDLEGYYEKYGWQQIGVAYGPSGDSIPLFENHTNQ